MNPDEVVENNESGIFLSSGEICTVDSKDFDELLKFKWSLKGGCYASTIIKGKQVMMHRMLLNAPKGVEVDHINHNGLDNRRANLRLVTRSQNVSNSRHLKRNGKVTTSQYRGVSRDNRLKSTWGAWKNGAFLGNYKSEAEAAIVYDLYTIKNCDEHARINFPILRKSLSGVLVPRVDNSCRHQGHITDGQRIQCDYCREWFQVESTPKRPVSQERLVRLVKDLIYCGHEMADTLQSYEDNKDVLHWLDLENEVKRILAEISEGEGK